MAGGEYLQGCRIAVPGDDPELWTALQKHAAGEVESAGGALLPWAEAEREYYTHVVASHRQEPHAAWATEAGKAVVTLLWLWDCLRARRRLPADSEPLYSGAVRRSVPGAAGLQVSTTGYQDLSKVVFAHMMQTLGLQFNKSMDLRRTHFLIASDVRDPDSKKVEAARQHARIKVVNVLWLYDSLRAGRVLPAEGYADNPPPEANPCAGGLALHATLQAIADSDSEAAGAGAAAPAERSPAPEAAAAGVRGGTAPAEEAPPEAAAAAGASFLGSRWEGASGSAAVISGTTSASHARCQSGAAPQQQQQQQARQQQQQEQEQGSPPQAAAAAQAQPPPPAAAAAQAAADNGLAGQETPSPERAGPPQRSPGPPAADSSPASCLDASQQAARALDTTASLVRQLAPGPSQPLAPPEPAFPWAAATPERSPAGDAAARPEPQPQGAAGGKRGTTPAAGRGAKRRRTPGRSAAAAEPPEPEPEAAGARVETSAAGGGAAAAQPRARPRKQPKAAAAATRGGESERPAGRARAAAAKEGRAAAKSAPAGQAPAAEGGPACKGRAGKGASAAKAGKAAPASGTSRTPPGGRLVARRAVFAVSNMHSAAREAAAATLRSCGAAVSLDLHGHKWDARVTHLVLARDWARGAKALAALAAGAWLLEERFLEACCAAHALLEEAEYEVGGHPKRTVSQGAPAHWRRRAAATGAGAFAGLQVAVYGEFEEGTRPLRQELLQVLQAGGAAVVPPSREAHLVVTKASRPAGDRKLRGACVAAPGFVVDWLAHPWQPLGKHLLFRSKPGRELAAAVAARGDDAAAAAAAPAPEGSDGLQVDLEMEDEAEASQVY